MIASRSRAAVRMCCTSGSFVAPPGRMATNSANPMIAFRGVRSFWFSAARNSRSCHASFSKGRIVFVSLCSFMGSIPSRDGEDFRFGFTIHSKSGRFVEAEVPQLLHHIDIAPHFVFVRAENHRGLIGDEIGLIGGEERLIEAVPAHRSAGFDDFLERPVLAFAVEQCFPRPQAASHDFRDEQATAVDFVNEPLAYDVTDRVRESLPELLFLFFAAHAEES